MHICLLFHFVHQTFYDTVLQHNNARPHQHATPHRTSPTTTSKFSPGLPCPHTLTQTNTLETSWRNMFKAEWTPLQMCIGRSGWPSQRQWFTTWSSPCLRDAEQLLILEENTPLTDVRVTQSENTEWLSFFLDEKSVKVLNFELNQLQNTNRWTSISLLSFWTSIQF